MPRKRSRKAKKWKGRLPDVPAYASPVAEHFDYIYEARSAARPTTFRQIAEDLNSSHGTTFTPERLRKFFVRAMRRQERLSFSPPRKSRPTPIPPSPKQKPASFEPTLDDLTELPPRRKGPQINTL